VVNYTPDPGRKAELAPRPLQRHPLILDGFFRLAKAPEGAKADGNCACTFYLVFKEPAFLRSPDCALYRRLGNLTSLPTSPAPVNPFFDAPKGCFHREGTYEKAQAELAD
jgi:hypothetical protein